MQENTIYTEIKDPYGFIYITTNLIDGKRYLGQRSFTNGWKTYLGSGLAFSKAVKKYGKKNFHRDIILICDSESELNEAEYELSVFFDVVESDNWYNLVLGGGTSRGWNPREETRKKISDSAKERYSDQTNHPRYGKHGLAGEINPQFGVSPKERMDEETYKQWYEKHKPYWENSPSKGNHIWANKPNPNLGKKMSDEEKDKIRQARLNNHIGCKPIYSIELNRIFYGAREIYEEFGFKKPNICRCCNKNISFCGRHPITNEKMHWLYTEDALQQGYITPHQLDDYLNDLKMKGNDTNGIMEDK